MRYSFFCIFNFINAFIYLSDLYASSFCSTFHTEHNPAQVLPGIQFVRREIRRDTGHKTDAWEVKIVIVHLNLIKSLVTLVKGYAAEGVYKNLEGRLFCQFSILLGF